MAELFPLRALGGEVILGQGMTAEQAANGGSTAWLLEHLVEGYLPCWQQNLGNGEFDSAVCDIGISRWSNYYLEGLRQIYFDGINFGRSTMLRIRRTLDEAVGPTAAIDLHAGNDFSSWGAGPALRYMHMLPFVDSLWFGESFRYNSPSDYWLTEISGLPFGLSTDMLGPDCRSPANCLSTSGPNPFRGMVFGMTGRYDEPTYASRLWHLWDEIGIEKMTMIGWFDADPAIKISYTNRTEMGLQQEQAPSPPPTNWSGPWPGFFSGCAGPGPGSPPPPCAGEDTLDAAERACDALPFAQCAGVTKEGPNFQLRQGPGLAPVPGGVEQSWAQNSNSTSSCPVALAPIDDPVQATAFVLKGQKALIALANFGLEDTNITLDIDWTQLGLSADSVKTLRAPLLGGFTPRDTFGRALPGTANLQEAAEFPVGGVIPVRGASGWLLMVEPAARFRKSRIKMDDAQWPSDSPFERLRARSSVIRDGSFINICTATPTAVQVLPSRRQGQPTGKVSVANASTIRGWCADPDSPAASLSVRIEIDGVVWSQQRANKPNDDHSGHGFVWEVNQIFGSAQTNHTIRVIAAGVDAAGDANGEDAVLPGADSPVKGSCHDIPEDCGPKGSTPAQEQCSLGAWCYDVPCYWQQRHADTHCVGNGHVRAGINTAFGGTVFALHRVDNNSTDTSYSRN